MRSGVLLVAAVLALAVSGSVPVLAMAHGHQPARHHTIRRNRRTKHHKVVQGRRKSVVKTAAVKPSSKQTTSSASATKSIKSPAATVTAGGAQITSTSGSTAPSASTASSGAVLGTFDISTAAQMSQWAAAGGNAVVIPVYWQAAQPTALGPVSLANAGNSGDNVTTEITTAHADGLAVYLEFDLQYPPQWVLSQVPQFVNQAGMAYSSPNPGANIRDWVWSASGRQAVGSFVSGALKDLQSVLGDVSGIRAGGGMYGELQFPADGPILNGQPSYWGYDAAAQTGAGLASGESATPLPGYVYGTGTATQDAQWANWYLQSLANWIHWYVLQLRTDGWNGNIYVLHPSYGLRSNWSPQSPAYEQQLSQGTDFGRDMDAYDTVPNVWPWSTWADDSEPYWSSGDTIDSDAAAWRKLLELAQQRGLAGHIMGENTGGGGSAAIQQLMSGALASGYKGIFYLNYPYLVANNLLGYLVSEFHQYAPASTG